MTLVLLLSLPVMCRSPGAAVILSTLDGEMEEDHASEDWDAPPEEEDDFQLTDDDPELELLDTTAVSAAPHFIQLL
jgi:hypothetical protein